MEEEENKSSKTKYRIGTVAIIVLVALAGIFDLLTLIPFVGDFIGWIFWIGAGIYLWKTGHGIVNWKILTSEIASTALEAIPVTQEFPTILIGILIIISISRTEDKTGISLMPNLTKKLPGTTPTRIYRQPLNKEGRRLPNKRSEIMVK